MKNTFFIAIIFCLLATTACEELDQSADVDNKGQCTQLGTLTSVNLRVAANSIPANLSVVLNGSDIYADECANNTNPFRNSIRVNTARTQADIILFLNTNQYVLNYYFPNGVNNSPQSQYMNVRFFSRANCNDGPTKIAEVNNVFMNWQALQPNGKNCGTTSFSATSEVSVY